MISYARLSTACPVVPIDPGSAPGEDPVLPLLYTDNLCVAYGGEAVLHNINVAIHKRRVTALMGPSGCGKSTFLKALNRSLELTPGISLTAGSVYLNGQNLYGRGVDSRAVRKELGIIQQRPQPFPMSVEENVLFGVRFHQRVNRRQRREMVERYLSQAGLWDEVKDRLGSAAHRLSGGQQQRLCLARTLANQPSVILMDEPCSSLDPASTERIEQLIRMLKNHYTIVIVTHNVAQSHRVADEVVLMMGGRVLEQGAAACVFDKPATQMGRDFLQGHIG